MTPPIALGNTGRSTEDMPAYLVDLTDRKDDVPSRASVGESEAERRARGIRDAIAAIIADGGGLRTADSLSREELYNRDRARDEAREAAAVENEKRERD